MRKNRVLILALALVLIFGVSVGGTLAWLLDDTDPVVNTFTDSDISITLEETDTKKDSDDDPNTNQYQMIPGWTIDKDPEVTVVDGSEDCWLFVKITESTSPDLDDYITYAIADKYDATTNPDGWQVVQDENTNGETVIGRKVYKNDNPKEFGIIGYTDTKGTADTADDEFVANKVLVKEDVTKEMMNALTDETMPTLTFTAYAVQLYQDNDTPFAVADAWDLAKNLPTTP